MIWDTQPSGSPRQTHALIGSPAAMSKMLADCEVLYIPVFLAGLRWRRLLTLKEASDARDNQMEFPI
jgi:hypothetical protein